VLKTTPDTPEELRAWKLFLLGPRLLLWAPKGVAARGFKGPGGRLAQQTAELSARLNLVSTGAAGWEALYNHTLERGQLLQEQRRTRPSKPRLQDDALAREALRRTALGEPKKAVQLLTAKGVVPLTDALKEQLEQLLLHDGSDPADSERNLEMGEGLNRFNFAQALRRMSRTSGPGPSGARPAHLQVLLGNTQALEAVAKLADRVVYGNLPTEIANFLSAVSLHPLGKKDSGVRPVGCGDAFRRLVGKALLRDNISALRECVGPLQLGTGVSNGAGLLAKTVQVSAEKRPDDAWIALDLSNAFGTLKRSQVFEAVRQAKLEHLLPHATLFLQRTSQYRLLRPDGTADWLEATVGVEQGDPWGPWYYALGMAPALAIYQERLAELAAGDRATRGENPPPR